MAISGTPGTGKTSAAAELKGRGFEVRRVEDVVEPTGRDGDELLFEESDLLGATVARGDGAVFIEGHLAHMLPNDATLVLRCSPAVIRKRLAERGYPPEKVRDNVEAEMVDVILREAESLGRKVVQLDATGLTPQAVADAAEAIAKGERLKSSAVDWLAEADAC